MAAVADKVALVLRRTHVRLKRPPQRRVVFFQRRNHALARRCVGCTGDLRAARRKPLLFLQLDALPRRIHQHDIEAGRASEQTWIMRHR